MTTLNLKLGCDPEIFMMDKQGILRSCVGKVGGSKAFPMPLTILGDGFAVQEDNVAMEFNIPPSGSAKEFAENIQKTLDLLVSGMEKRFGYVLSNLSAGHFEHEELNTPQAKEFGCDPDYNAWTGKRNPRPRATDPNLRSCGGHVHVGYLESEYFKDEKYHSKEFDRKVIRSMDLILGVPSILMDKGGDLRRELYGKAGAYRPKSYGVEYRTLGNFWALDKKLCEWVFENTERAVAAAVAQIPFEEDADMILDAINNNNKEAAAGLVKKYDLNVLNA
jgi:hypothetical protein